MPNAFLRLHLMTVKLLELENKPAEVHCGPQKEEMRRFLINHEKVCCRVQGKNLKRKIWMGCEELPMPTPTCEPSLRVIYVSQAAARCIIITRKTAWRADRDELGWAPGPDDTMIAAKLSPVDRSCCRRSAPSDFRGQLKVKSKVTFAVETEKWQFLSVLSRQRSAKSKILPGSYQSVVS